LNKILSFTGKTRKVLPPDYNIFSELVASFLITYVAIPKVIFFAQQFRLTDVAGKRAVHEGSTPRDEVNEEAEMQTNFINFGLVTDLSNHYYDF
jgi:hypothetical protein